METSTALHSHDPHDPHGHGGHEEHHELGFWRKWVFSTDHKMIGIQYGVTGLCFLFFGFCLMLLMRCQLANPGKPVPLVGAFLARIIRNDGMNSGGVPGVMTSDFYNSLGAMHGTIMVFLGIVPIAFAAFGNFVVPLQIGAPDMTFPRINMASFHSFWIGGAIMLGSFFCPTGPAKGGWTSYAPLSDLADQAPNMFFTGQSLWILGMVFLITSSLLGAVNFVTTIIQLRAPGMTWMRMPFFCWVQLITAFILLLAFPPLEAASLMQLMDRLFGTSFFLPHGLTVSNHLVNISGGGSPLLWQHLFWFLGHPEVYVLILPGLGIIAEVVTNNTRRPLWGYKAAVFAALGIGFLSFVVWAHHMYLTGMGSAVSTFFQTTTILISVPSVIILTCLLLSLWGGSIRFTVPMLFATAFMPEFGIGGLTGIPLAFNSTDLYLHDTYYIIAHFHYIVAPGTIFAIFAGVYYWYPKATGRMMNEFWGKVHFWGSAVMMNFIFFPMFLQGMAGMHRRGFDGGATYDLNKPVIHWNTPIFHSALTLGLFQIPFIINFFWSIKHGKKIGNNPWNATTIEWAAPSPPPHGNFLEPVAVYRGPYEYSVPGHPIDFISQCDPQGPRTDAGAHGH
jgi:cytochrome c oxidase subunit 1